MKQNGYVAEALKDFYLPRYTEIPDVGLYLDQVTKYINGFFVSFPEMNVTPSMISNYVKLKMVSKPNKKTYDRDQIAYFLIIVLAKTVLSMNHIQKMFETQKENYSVEKAYEFFRQEFLSQTSFSEEKKTQKTSPLSEDKEMVHRVVVAIVYKMYLELYFESKSAPLKS